MSEKKEIKKEDLENVTGGGAIYNGGTDDEEIKNAIYGIAEGPDKDKTDTGIGGSPKGFL